MRTVAVPRAEFLARAILAKAFAARRIGPLLAEFLVGKPLCRAGIAAISARCAIVPFGVSRALAARRVGALLAATILALPAPSQDLLLVKALHHYARAVAHAMNEDAAKAKA